MEPRPLCPAALNFPRTPIVRGISCQNPIPGPLSAISTPLIGIRSFLPVRPPFFPP